MEEPCQGNVKSSLLLELSQTQSPALLVPINQLEIGQMKDCAAMTQTDEKGFHSHLGISMPWLKNAMFEHRNDKVV